MLAHPRSGVQAVNLQYKNLMLRPNCREKKIVSRSPVSIKFKQENMREHRDNFTKWFTTESFPNQLGRRLRREKLSCDGAV